MNLDNRKAGREIENLRKQLRSLSYLIRMDHVDPENFDDPLVSKRGKLELCLENLLTLVRREKEHERKVTKSD
jgi:hypothetical protein